MGDVYTNPPQSRNEAILNSIVEGTEYTAPPQSRIEDLLLEVKEVIEEGGHDESATRASIAPTESDAAHASKRIEIGEQFYLSDDKLYKATAVIAQGTAIVTTGAGKNCEVSESVTGQIAEQEQLLEDTVGWTGVNLFTTENLTVGSYLNQNGTLTSATNWRITDYIDISDLSKIELKGKGANGNNPSLCFYNSNKDYISGIPYLNRTDIIVDKPSNAVYSKISVFVDDMETMILTHPSVDTTKTDNSVIGTVEDGATASQAYAVGSHFIRNKAFCTVTSAISANESLVGSSKFTSGDVAGNIADIYANIGLLTTPVSAVVANSLPVLKRNITSDFYNGSLRGEIASGNFKNVRAGDYIIGQSTGSTYYVACIDWMFNKGDQTNATYQAQAYGQHHLGLMLFKPVGTTSLWLGKGDAGGSWQVSANDKGRCPWNAATDVDPTSTSAVGSNDTNITRTYGGASVSGYMGSFIRERMDAILLPQCFQADFGSSNVLKFRNLNGNAITTDKPSGGQGNWNGCTTGWAWYDRYLDLPSEVEVYGSRVFGSAYDIGVQCERLPMFKNADINAFYPRLDFWTKAVASSSFAAFRGGRGVLYANGASSANWACPLACVR